MAKVHAVTAARRSSHDHELGPVVAEKRRSFLQGPSFMPKLATQISMRHEKEPILKKSTMKMEGFRGVLYDRNVVLNPDKLYYTAVDSDQKIGTIQLSDLVAVHRVREFSREASTTQPQSPGPLAGTLGGSQKSLAEKTQYGFEVQLQGMWVDEDHQIKFYTDSEEEQDEWVRNLEDLIRIHHAGSHWQKFRSAMRRVYNHAAWQFGVVLFIFSNFVINIVEAEMVPSPGSRARDVFDQLDLWFTIIFTAELVGNLLANWPSPFLDENIKWNIADTVIVAISLLSLSFEEGIPGVKIVRIFRCFRVVRVFKRLKSLRLIVTALGASLEPIVNTCMVLLLATSVYAILAVGLYGEEFHDEFGTFSRSFFTMMQCTTMDGWASEVARPMFRSKDSNFDGAVAFFFLSYVVLVCLVVVNVMVAVLLDEFLRVRDLEKSTKVHLHREEHCLDPLLTQLAVYYDDLDLTARLKDLFDHLDVEKKGRVTMEYFIMGIKQLDLKPALLLCKEDYRQVFRRRMILYHLWSAGLSQFPSQQIFGEPEHALKFSHFEKVMRHEMSSFVQRSARKFMAAENDNATFTAGTADLLLLKHIVTLLENAASRPQGSMPLYQNEPATLSPNKSGEFSSSGEEPQSQVVYLIERVGRIDQKVEHLSKEHQSSVDRLERKVDLLIEKLAGGKSRALDAFEQSQETIAAALEDDQEDIVHVGRSGNAV